MKRRLVSVRISTRGFCLKGVIEAIEAVVQEGHIDLQETLLERTAERLLKYPEVAAVQIGSEKPDAYSKAESIGVEAFFSKDKERIKTE